MAGACRYRDSDGVTRIVQRIGPADEFDKHGKLAEDALIAALAERRAAERDGRNRAGHARGSLVDQHIARLAEDGRSARTLDTYRYDAAKLARFIAGVRVGEASPAALMRRCARCVIPTARRWRAGSHAAARCPPTGGTEQRPRYQPEFAMSR